MTIEQMMMQSEALIFGSAQPISAQEIEQVLKEMTPGEADFDPEKLSAALDAIIEKYASDFYPFEIKRAGGGYQFLTKKDFYPTLSRLNSEKFARRLSTASLETLSIIAYRQPITKTDIEHIRGVNSDYSVQKLLEKELIVISGRLEDVVGKPLTYSTSRMFMNYLGINNLDELPKLHEISAQELIEPTAAVQAMPDDLQHHSQWIVSEEGELLEMEKNADPPASTKSE